MAHNKTLAKLRGISEEDTQKIDEIHEQLEKLVSRATNGAFNTSVYNAIEQKEFELQALWGFPQDANYHSWKDAYAFKAQWCGRRYRCIDTGEEFVIPFEVRERDYFVVGNGAIDCGRLNGYHRIIGNVQEVKVPVVEL